MAHLVLIIVLLALLCGFIALTEYEARRGARLFAARRANLDRDAERIKFIFEHVNFAAFARDESRRIIGNIGHESAHISLNAIRAAERLLTRLVRNFHTRHTDDAAPSESARPFLKSLSDFKSRLKAAHPELKDPDAE